MQYEIARVGGAVRYVGELMPDYVDTQSTIAIGHRDAAVTEADEVHTFVTTTANTDRAAAEHLADTHHRYIAEHDSDWGVLQTANTVRDTRDTRDSRVSAVNDQRAVAHWRSDQAHAAETDRIDREAQQASDANDQSFASASEYAQFTYEQSIDPQGNWSHQVPTVSLPGNASLGLTARGVGLNVRDGELVDALTAMIASDGYGLSARGVSPIADSLLAGVGWSSVSDMHRFAWSASTRAAGDLIRGVPGGGALMEFSGTWSTLFPQQAQTNAATLRGWGRWTHDGIIDIGNWAANETGLPLYYYSELGSRLSDTGFGLVGLLVDPASAASGIGRMVGAHWQAGGILGVAGMFTGTVGLYEGYTGEDFLSGERLIGDERFDRTWMGASGLLTSVGGTGVSLAKAGGNATVQAAARSLLSRPGSAWNAPNSAVLRSSSKLNSVERATPELLDAVRSKGRTIKFVQEGSDEARYLDFIGAEANVGGETMSHILLRPNPGKAAVLEEFLHGTQYRLGIVDRLGVNGAETHVKDFMIRHRRLLGLGDGDVNILRQLMEAGL